MKTQNGLNEFVSHDHKVIIWDPLVRVCHWLVVGGFFIAYVTENEALSAHVWAGYLVGAVVLMRIVWGFIGTKHARFVDFLYGPRDAVSYLGGLLRGGGRRYLGHSPAGGVMVVLLILGLVATTWSGLMVYAYDQQAGPLTSLVASLPNAESASTIEGEDPDVEASPDASAAFEAREQFWEEVHEVIVNLTLLLVVLHIGGVLLASLAHRENLVAAMITGKKRTLTSPRVVQTRGG